MEIINPGEKIEVTESVRQYKPGSTGYLAFQASTDYNLWDTYIVFTKFGKKGKDRIELTGLDTEMVDIDKIAEISTEGRELVKTAPAKLGLLPHSSGYLISAKIKRVPIESKNVTGLKLWDFLGYISSLSIFMNRLAYGVLKQRTDINMDWDGMNIFDIESKMLGHFICHAVRKDTRAAVREMYLDHFRNSNNRITWMYKLHRDLVLLQQRAHKYSENVKAAHFNMQQRLIEAADYCMKHGGKSQETITNVVLEDIKLTSADHTELRYSANVDTESPCVTYPNR